ncbi:MAG: hypothetical protein MJ112_03710 [Lachnospiraceae bacterium]|nr:hypothetical protein [Lachnospiraceae bacterium]
MGKVYACVGRYASTPYTIKKSCIHVYCVEELCYYIRNNAYFMDDDFFDNDLYLWLEEECNLPTLAKNLRAKARIDKRIECTARFLLESVHYCSEEEIVETETLLQTNRNMSGKKKLKLRADYFLSAGKTALAMQTYEDLLVRLDVAKDARLVAAVYHNLGVIYAKMFLFSEAADYFEKAYDLDGDKKHQICLLAAKRMSLSDDGYLKAVSKMEDAFESSNILEGMLEEGLSDMKQSDEYLRLKGMSQLGEQGDQEEYTRSLNQQLTYFKDNYRGQLEH